MLKYLIKLIYLWGYLLMVHLMVYLYGYHLWGYFNYFLLVLYV